MQLAEIDDTALLILRELQDNARMNNAELAKRVGLSPSACLRRVNAMEESGLIEGYVTRVSREATGYSVSVFANVTLERQVDQDLAVFEERIVACPEVMDCYLMTGDSDYLLHVVVSDMPDYERFLSESLTMVPGIERVRSSVCLRTVVERTTPPLRATR